jgi:hypothetical protein
MEEMFPELNSWDGKYGHRKAQPGVYGLVNLHKPSKISFFWRHSEVFQTGSSSVRIII